MSGCRSMGTSWIRLLYCPKPIILQNSTRVILHFPKPSMGNCLSLSLQSNAIDSAFSQCFESSGKRAKFIYALDENLDALRTALEELTDTKNDLLRRVNVAEQQQQLTRLDVVQRWITRVEEMEKEVKRLLSQSTQEVGKLCLWGCCSKSCLSSYNYGKEVSKKLDEMKGLKSKGVFEVMAERAVEASVVEMPLEPTVGMESLFDEVWRDICDEYTRIMGLFGMGGVGKTTLLKKINNKFLEATNGDYSVMWIVVSKDHKLENIQNDLGEKLGFSDDAWKRRECLQKAADILRVLKNKRFVLLLDDIWERIDLVNLGVPLSELSNGSKVIFTTRSEDVCSHMKADKKVKVKCLEWEKSWKLFKENVGEEALSVHPEILGERLAESVAKECDGLPLALITIGRTMACKRTAAEWRHALRVLKNSASSFSGLGDKVLQRLKFSYDNLHEEKFKPCFLYCAMFPEDFMIDKELLIEYWICEGFLETDEYDEGSHIIGSLLNACLLEEVDDYGVKMHDVIRDMALWIACDCGKTRNRVLVQPKVQLLDPPAVEIWNVIKRLSLMDNDIERLSGTPTCPNLETLFVQSYKLSEIDDSFFEVMPKLKVLDLSQTQLTCLPKSISKLVALQYLDLSDTDVRELPEELGNLVMLKYLNLNYAHNLFLIPHQLISKFSQLQILKVFRVDPLFDIVQYDTNEVALVEELKRMTKKHLTSVEVSINSLSAMEMLFTCQELLSLTRGLSFHPRRNEHLLGMSNLSKIFCSPLYLPSLQQLFIKDCKLLEITCLSYAPNLRLLEIVDCLELKEIICLDKVSDSEAYPEPFLKLEEIFLINLPSLTSIYKKPLSFPRLVRFLVTDCTFLKKLPMSHNITNTSKLRTIYGTQTWWNELIWDDDASRDYFQPYFEAGDY